MVSESNVPTNDTAIGRFRRWYWRPPRAHGEAIEDRTVGFLELFYDLVYVVVIAQAAHHLAEHLTGRGVIEFAIVFGLIWIAWLNGTLYVDLHGREDGRTRTLVFAQMALLALLAVFTSGAGSKTSTEFALVYIAFMLLLIAMWYSVRRQDDPRFHAMTARYLAGMIVTVAAIAISVVLPDGLRLAVWAAVTVGWVVGTLVAALVASRRGRDASDLGGTPTDSLVERFGLFTIIVLGEVVVGVVDGMGEIELDLLTMVTGFLALVVGFGLWWVFFDFVGRRLPRADVGSSTRWMMSHLPVTASIAAAGASMVSLIHHAHDEATPAATAWLLSGSVAVALAAIIVIVRTLVDYERLKSVYRPITIAMAVGAVAALVVGWLQPAPWLLALLLSLILSLVWMVAVDRWLRVRQQVLATEASADDGAEAEG
jgi:low temperature requirement protein LtrA